MATTVQIDPPVVSGQQTMLDHATESFFCAIDLEAQNRRSEALEQFKKSISLFKILADQGSPEIVEWCFHTIEEANTHILQLNIDQAAENIPVESQTENETTEEGTMYRVVCSLDLVSCFLMSRLNAEELITDGASDPICLLVKGKSTDIAMVEEEDAPSAILQITSQIAYPLAKSVPCLKYQPGYYILALLENQYYGIVFPEGYPKEAIFGFEEELGRYCSLCFQDDNGQIHHVVPTAPSADDLSIESFHVVNMTPAEPQPPHPETALHSFAEGINWSASYVTWGIKATSDLLRSGIENTGSAVSSVVGKTDKDVHVPHAVKSSVGFVSQTVAPTAVYISGGAASALASLATFIGSSIATGVKTVLPSRTSSNPHMGGLAAVGSATVGALSSVWVELNGVGKNLIEGTQNASVQIVETRFGKEMGALTGEVIGIGKDAYITHSNISSIGIKSLAKGSVKAAGKNLIRKEASEHQKEIAGKPNDPKGLPAPKKNEAALISGNTSIKAIEAPPTAEGPQPSMFSPSAWYSKLVGASDKTGGASSSGTSRP